MVLVWDRRGALSYPGDFVTRLIKLCALCLAGVAQASGFYLGDNGAKAMVQGGAFAGQADDSTAMQHNPAGLAWQPGFNFLVDLTLINHDITFSRQDPGFDPAAPSTLINTVHNTPGLFKLPFFAASYGFPIAGRTFTVGLGLFAPPSQGEYHFPTPNYARDPNDSTKYLERPNKYAPQRYAMISNNIVIAYPTLSLAYDVHPRFQVGISAQLTLSQFQQTQTMYGGDAIGSNPVKQLLENPDYDATVSIDLPGQVGFTGILGLMWRPVDWLSIGGSVRPPIHFKGRGKITVTLPEFFKSAGATVSGETANLVMTLPLEVKLGAHMTPIAGLGINLDFVYQGWNSINQLLLTPEDVTLSAGPGAEAKAIPAFAVRKDWLPTVSVRLGGTYKIFKDLSVSAGAMYETGAAPSTTYSVDWTNPSRVIVTGGLTGHLAWFDVIAGAFYTPTVTTVVTDSIVSRGQTDPNVVPGTVGNGIYTSGAWALIFGIRGHFGADAPAMKPMVEGAPAAAASPTPAPAATPAADAPAAAP